MYYLDLTLPNSHENLACDEALLDMCEAGDAGELLRFWEPQQHFVVLGYSRPLSADVHPEACHRYGVPILRRCSGGGTVLQGPGCLNFSLIVNIQRPSPFGTLRGTNAAVARRHQQALEPVLEAPIACQPPGDLVLGTLKFSGSAQRRRRHFALFHGTFLLSLDLRLMAVVLPVPAIQPAYRHNRPHEAFLRNLRIPATRLKDALRAAWQAAEPFPRVPQTRIEELASTRYATEAWTRRL